MSIRQLTQLVKDVVPVLDRETLHLLASAAAVVSFLISCVGNVLHVLGGH